MASQSNFAKTSTRFFLEEGKAKAKLEQRIFLISEKERVKGQHDILFS